MRRWVFALFLLFFGLILSGCTPSLTGVDGSGESDTSSDEDYDIWEGVSDAQPNGEGDSSGGDVEPPGQAPDVLDGQEDPPQDGEDPSEGDDSTQDPGEGDDGTQDPGEGDGGTQDPGEDDNGGGDDPPAPAPPRFETHFNEPAGGGNDDHLEDVLIDLLGKAEPGSKVRAAFYSWSRQRVARAFVNAYNAGVDVQVVVGNTNRHANGEDWEAIKTLKNGLGSRLTICREGQSSGGCIGKGINHNKFTIFSALDDGSKDVVFQSSANHTNPQRKDFNNAIIIRGDTALYTAYSNYWTDLKAQQQNLNYYRSFNGDHRTKVYFYPRKSGDTIVSILNNITCDNNSYIHVGMAFFSNPRVAVAERLAARQREGCKVRVIADGPEIGNQVLNTLRGANIEVKVFSAGAQHRVHSKYLLINAPYGSNQTRQKLVWTGSHNYTGPALREHDETLLKIRNDEVYDAYLANWQMMRNRL